MPLCLVLEFVRSTQPADLFAVCLTRQTYLLRHEEDGSYGSAEFSWSAEFLGLLAGLADSRRDRHGNPQADRELAQQVGYILRSFLMQLGWERYERSVARALHAGHEVCVTIRTCAAELYYLPWELLTLKWSGQHLGEFSNCFLRYEWPGIQAAALTQPFSPPGRLIIAWSAAGGWIPADSHLFAIEQACRRNRYPFDLRRDVLPNASREVLVRALADSQFPIAALHILCHSTRTAAENYGLVLDASNSSGGAAEVIDAGLLRHSLGPYAGIIRVIVLCACGSGDPVLPGSYVGGFAQALHRVGFPAIVASRFPMTVEGSVTFARSFYDGLLDEANSVHKALGHARRSLANQNLSLDWASLQLYSASEERRDSPLAALPSSRGIKVHGREQQRRSEVRRRPMQSRRTRKQPSPAQGRWEASGAGNSRRHPFWLGLKRLQRGVALSVVACTAVVVMFAQQSRLGTAGNLWREREPIRSLEARVSLAAADRYRPPPAVLMGDTTRSAPLPLQALGELEERGELHALAVAYLVRERPTEALMCLDRLDASLDSDVARSAALIALNKFDDALTVLDRVLEWGPNCPQALWNRALVLRALHLPLSAAKTFDEVAALGEPGWSDEAKAKASGIEEVVRSSSRGWLIFKEEIDKLIEGNRFAISSEMSHRLPILRSYFYEAVRSADTPERAAGLLPLARELDLAAGGDVLTRYVRRVLVRNFERRGPWLGCI